MIICSVSLAVVFLIIFIIGARKGHFEDDESPAVRILMDDEIKDETLESEKKKEKIIVICRYGNTKV